MTQLPLAPQNEPSPFAAALRLAREGDPAAALAALRGPVAHAAAGGAREEAARALQTVAHLAERADDPDTSQQALELALTLVDWADLHCRLGTRYAARNRRADARRELERALALNPGYRAAAVERALLDAREGRVGDALAALRALAAGVREAEPGALAEGLARLGEAEFDDAGPLLRRALQAGDPWLDDLLLAVQADAAGGDPAQARRRLREAVEARPAYPDLHALLAVHELQLGSTDDAIESACEALALNPDFHAARVTLARALELRGDRARALAQLERVLAAEPAQPEALALHERLSSHRRAAPQAAGARGRGARAGRARERA